MFNKPMVESGEAMRPSAIPPIWMRRPVVCQIMCTIGCRKPESGGILLGPIGGNDITAYYFDATAQCSGGTYSPDTLTLRRKMKAEWLPAGLDFKGFVHSHPGTLDRLSAGDLVYIRRLMDVNPDMASFAAPIVIPGAFRLRPIIVLREQLDVQHPTTLRFF